MEDIKRRVKELEQKVEELERRIASLERPVLDAIGKPFGDVIPKVYE